MRLYKCIYLCSYHKNLDIEHFHNPEVFLVPLPINLQYCLPQGNCYSNFYQTQVFPILGYKHTIFFICLKRKIFNIIHKTQFLLLLISAVHSF